MAMKFEICTAKNGQFYFHLKDDKGEIVLSSEMYVAKASAQNGIASVKKNAPNKARFELKMNHQNHYMFNLKAGNHEVIGTSKGFATEAGRDEFIKMIHDGAPAAAVADLTTSAAKAASAH